MDSIDDFNDINDDISKTAPTPTSGGGVMQTPGGSRRNAHSVGNKAKEFNQ